MRIGFDVRPLQTAHRGAGIGTYTFNLLKHLVKLDSPDEWICYTLPDIPLESDVPLPYRIQVKRPRRTSRIAFWEQLLLPIDMMRGRIDVFHATGGLTQVWEICAPYFQPCRTIITVQDLHPLILPQFRFIAEARTFRWQIQALRKAAGIIAVSHNTKADIMRLVNIPDERIEVIPMAPGDHFQRMDEARVREILKPYALSGPFVLYVGNYNVHKNIETLLEAWARLKPVVPLVIVGKQDSYPQSFHDRAGALNRSGALRFISGLDNSSEALVALYNAASVFVFPSLYEGFGLPVVEAMKCGCPVVASNRGSLPEVAGDAGVLLAPDDMEGFTAAIQRILDDPDWRTALQTHGFKQAGQFTWRQTAQRTLETYHEVGRSR